MTDYRVGLVVAAGGLSEHQAQELGNLMRSWATYVGVYHLDVWGGSIDRALDLVSKDKAYGYYRAQPAGSADTVAAMLSSFAEVYCFPAKGRTLCNPDHPLQVARRLDAIGYKHHRVVYPWVNQHRAPGS